jgi:hypothetical protein
MEERRGKTRVRVNSPVSISLDGLALDTLMVDLSDDGALLRVSPDYRGKISTMDLGKEATFVVRIKGGSSRRYTGEVIRFFIRGEDKYIALRFWEGYQELSS